MPIENPNTIDIITRPAPDALNLLITDSGQTSEPEARLALFKTKLARYAAYVAAPKFEHEYPGVLRERVTIILVSRFEATPEMKAITSVPLPIGATVLRVVFDVYQGEF
jgi:hypothetical protein